MDGYPYFEDYVRTASGDTASISADLVLTQAWEGDDRGGTYRLSFVRQTTIRPTTVRVSISAPDGMRFTSWDDAALTRRGSRWSTRGRPPGDLDLEASFAPPLPVRIWRTLT